METFPVSYSMPYFHNSLIMKPVPNRLNRVHIIRANLFDMYFNIIPSGTSAQIFPVKIFIYLKS